MPAKICANAPSPLVRHAVDPGIVPQAASLAFLRWHACAAVCVSIVPLQTAHTVLCGRPGGPRLMCSCSSLMFAHGRKHLQDLLYLALSVVPVLVLMRLTAFRTHTDTRAPHAISYRHKKPDYILTIRVCITALVEAGGDGIC